MYTKRERGGGKGFVCMCVTSFLNFFSVPEPTILVTYISVTVSGSSADVCVETKDAATVKLI